MSQLSIQDAAHIPAELRRAYLDELIEPQEFFIEQLVQAGKTLVFSFEKTQLGYAVVNGSRVVELWVTDRGLRFLQEIVNQLIDTYQCRRMLCKSFDSRMITAASLRPARAVTTGLAFRKIIDVHFASNPEISYTEAGIEHLSRILAIHDGFFDSEEEIKSYISEAGLLIYSRAGEDVGCGIFKRVIAGRDAFDIGMVVNPNHRGCGLGTYIIQHLKHLCLNRGIRPICGCSVDNPASRRCLEKAGFAATHTLIDFEY